MFTALIAIRSWYHPEIKINQVSPINIQVADDVAVKDVVATKEAREKAKLDSINNIGNIEILMVDDAAIKQNKQNLKEYITVIKSHLRGDTQFFRKIDSKISIETQRKIIKLEDSEFYELNSFINEIESLNPENLKPELYEIWSKFEALPEIEKEIFWDRIKLLRDKYVMHRKIISDLGGDFFDNLEKLEDTDDLFNDARKVQAKLMDLGIVNGYSKEKIADNIRILYPTLANNKLKLIQNLLSATTTPNVTIDWQKVAHIEEDAVSSVPDLLVTLAKGTILAEKGKKVSEKNYFFLDELDLLHPEPDWKSIRLYLYIVMISAAIMLIYVTIVEKRRYSIQKIGLIMSASLAVVAIIAVISMWGINKLAIAPLSVMPMILTLFYFPALAMFLTTLIAFFLVFSFDLTVWQVLPLYVGAMYSIPLVNRAHQREDLSNAGTKIAVAQAVVFVAVVTLAAKNFAVSQILIIASLYMISGIASGLISIAALPYLESAFRLLTPFKLAELSNPNQPLLKKLKKDAPGTYQHSINVTRLAEEAGAAIGANTELMRVGLLYHDIGKTYKAEYFIENNLGKPNPHNTLNDPKKSAQIVIAHVPEGIKLAKKYKLPPAIIDFIPMHQGTTITNYFYYQAIERFGADNVDPEDFRYPGPSPNTRETGIAMIADSVEAALTSMKDLHDESLVYEKINNIINSRFNEGELDNSGLTEDELKIIATAFLDIWRSQNHERVKYPDKPAGAKTA
jgi:putative nucleotidyltransferase with HDIG domain